MPTLTYVKDYKGNLIPKKNSRRIKGEDGTFNYYEIGVSCIKMPDGIYYRTTTGKILYDHSIGEWVFSKDFSGSKGLVHDRSIGFYSDTSKEVTILHKDTKPVAKTVFDPISQEIIESEDLGKRWTKTKAIDEQVALKYGYVESIYDGNFYFLEHCNSSDLTRIKTPHIPNEEKTNTYSLDDDKAYRAVLESKYDNNNLKVSSFYEIFCRKNIPYTFGCELETQNGFVPLRIREPLGFRHCRDGSLDGGQEYVSVPMSGGKGLAVLEEMCKELTKRCTLSNKCSLHIHFGNTRRDKLYIVSLWYLFTKIQEDFRHYFPFSRTNSIREDGKIYANLLPSVLPVLDNLMNKEEEEFKYLISEAFNSIYCYLNRNHPLGETFESEFVKETKTKYINNKPEKFYSYRVKQHKFTTKLPVHAVQGRKWDKKERYLAMNILNLFFSNSRTVEMRIHEATTNFSKVFAYLCICVSILKYAENFTKVFSSKSISLEDIIKNHFDEKTSNVLINYMKMRKQLFCTTAGGFKSNWKSIEQQWLEDDKNFKILFNE